MMRQDPGTAGRSQSHRGLLIATLFFAVGLNWAVVGCGGGDGKPDDAGIEDAGLDDAGTEDGGGEGHGSILGQLASATSRQSSRSLSWLLGLPDYGGIEQGLSLDEITVDLLWADGESLPEDWPVQETATPDASGAFAFEGLAEHDYALRVNQPEFAELAYRVDSTDFHLGPDQTINLVLPLVTTIIHKMMDPDDLWNPMANIPPASALDQTTGEIVLTSSQGFAVIDPDRGKMDLLFSQNLFVGKHNNNFPPQRVVIALAPSGIAWILYSDRLLRIDRSLFSNPEESESYNLDELSVRVAVGDRIRI